jgi:hypothetical protein
MLRTSQSATELRPAPGAARLVVDPPASLGRGCSVTASGISPLTDHWGTLISSLQNRARGALMGDHACSPDPRWAVDRAVRILKA